MQNLPLAEMSLAYMGQGLVYPLAFFLAIIIIVFIHEFGHFIVGRWSGVTIEAFSIGFGKEIWGFNDRHGTRWKLSWIPLGGYVKFKGDANVASMPSAEGATPGSLQAAALWKRALIVVAGPAANFLTAIAVFTAGFMVVGTLVVDPKIDKVTPGSAAEAAGLLPGDTVLSVDGTKVVTFTDLQDYMILRGTEPVTLGIDRNGQNLSFQLVPKMSEVDDGLGGKVPMALIGIQAAGGHLERLGPGAALSKGVDQTYTIVANTLRYVGQVFVGKQSLNQAHGPAAIAKMAGDTMMAGSWVFIIFVGLISVSVGLVNLFPIPMLDGGHLLFYLIEAIKGRPLSTQTQEWGFRIGLSIILMLAVLVTRNDLGLFGH